MTDNVEIVFRSNSKAECSDRALVLQSVDIPNALLADDTGFAVAVPSEHAEKAKFELWEYEEENRQPAAAPVKLAPDYQRSLYGVYGYIAVVLAVGWMSGQSSFGLDWYGAGRVDGTYIRDGEWWRAITALTLHGGLKHLLGNLVFGLFFGLLAGGLVGPGAAWLGAVIAGAAGNLLNTYFLDATHRSIGASTAVFAMLGILTGFVWRSRLMAQDRWAWRFGPIVGGLALLAFTGTGEPGSNTDVGAHLTGFACGFLCGMVLCRFGNLINRPLLQRQLGFLAVGIVAVCWAIGFDTWNSRVM